jgi:ATP-binding cassette, subfamily B, bacterial PglK
MLETILRPIKGFSKKELGFILVLVLIASLLEVLSIGAVLPIISAITEDNTEKIFFYQYLSNFFEIKDKKSFVVIISIIIIIIFLLKFFLLIFITLRVNLFIIEINKFVSNKVLSAYLSRSLLWHASYNKSTFLNIIITEVSRYCGHCIKPLFSIIIDFFLFIGIITFLVLINVKLFLILFFISLSIFTFIFYFSRKINYKLGKTKLSTSQNIFVFLNENLSGIKEIILYSGKKFILGTFLNLFKENQKSSALHESFQDIIRFFIEIIGLFLILTIFYILLNDIGDNKSLTIGTLGIYAASLFKLLPIYNRINMYSQKIQFGLAGGEKVSKFLNDNLEIIENKIKNETNLNDKIEFKNVSFKFDDSDNFILKNINFEIKKNEIIGIAGKSGSGKTTLTNILMNLIDPTNGEINIDGKNIFNENLSYKKSIGFVSQNFFHTDDTILKNITLNARKISINDLKFAIKNSLLLDPLLRKELRLKSKLGNSALKISGGQLQRINLARALYRKPKILILDEPTSALDKKTQEDFTNIIKNLKSEMTIIIVSHSESLLTHCDRVYYLSDGILSKK